jgi:hypothetical protein
MLKKLLLLSVLSVAIVSCSGSNIGSSDSDSDSNSGSSERYPSEVRVNFISNCELTSGTSMTVSESEDYCQCLLESLEASMSIDEFLEAEQAMMRGEATDLNLVELAAECI